MDAAEDRDVQILQASAELLDSYSTLAPSLVRSKSGNLHTIANTSLVNRLIVLLEPFQESPQLLDPHLLRFITPLTDALVEYIRCIATLYTTEPTDVQCTLPVAIAKLLYTLIKIRGHKIISRFLPNEPFLLEPVSALFMRAHTIGIDTSWELRYVLLLWLSHLLLAPFDLSTISENSDVGTQEKQTVLEGTGLDVSELPSLCRRLLALGVEYLSSPGNRENDAAALLLIRISLRKDMREIGLLEALTNWGLGVIRKKSADSTSRHLFLKTGVLTVLAGVLAQGESEVVSLYASSIYELVQELQDGENEPGADWTSAGIRRLGMKIYRHVALLALGSEDAAEGIVEDVIERLLNSLGDRDTAVRFGASKSLAVVARKLDPDMAGDVLEAVMGIYEEDVLLDPPIPKDNQRQRRILSAVSPERWHGATLTLATFLRQRAVRTTEVLEHVLNCIIEALSFEQRRATFAVGGNVRDAACYAAWSLARNYTTTELLAAGSIIVSSTAFNHPRTIPQILATELTIAGCLDPLGNVRRASSAALQELIGRHPNCVQSGIPLVQAVDYSAVALRRRSVIEVSQHAAELEMEYWHGLAFAFITGWRGIGASDEEGRRLAAAGLKGLVSVNHPGGSDSWSDRIREVLDTLITRILTEGSKHIEIFHGGLWALSTLLDGICTSRSPTTVLSLDHVHTLTTTIPSRLSGKEFTNPILRPDLISESTSRLVNALCSFSSSFPSSLVLQSATLRKFTAIIEAALLLTKDLLTEQAILAAHSLFAVLNQKNRGRLIEGWTTRTISPSNRFRGPVSALAEVAEYAVGEGQHKDQLRNLISALISAAKKQGDIEMRVTGIKALTRGVITKGLGGLMESEIMKTVEDALEDYEVDLRGDVGSWARSEAVSAVIAFHQLQSPSSLSSTPGLGPTAPPVPLTSPFAPQLARIALEKLDRLRLISASSLLPEPLPPVASQGFFHMLLKTFTPHQHLISPAITGVASATGTGSDSVMQTARRAFISYATNCSQDMKREIARAVKDTFKEAVAKGVDGERVVIAILESLGLWLEAGVVSVGVFAPSGEGEIGMLKALKEMRSIFITTQKAHFKTGSIAKLDAAVHVYGAIAIDLLCTPAEQEDVVKAKKKLLLEVFAKLVSLLLHPFPRVRVIAAETTWFVINELEFEAGETGERWKKVKETVEMMEWAGAVKGKLTEAVESLKREMGQL